MTNIFIGNISYIGGKLYVLEYKNVKNLPTKKRFAHEATFDLGNLIAGTSPYFGNEIRLARPPWAVQRTLFGVLAPVGRLLGYREQYPYPYDGPEKHSVRADGRSSVAPRARGGAVGVTLPVGLLVLFLLLRRRRPSGR